MDRIIKTQISSALALACLGALIAVQVQAAEIVPPLFANASQGQPNGYAIQQVGYNAACDGCAAGDCGCGSAGCADDGCCGSCGESSCCCDIYQPCQSFWTVRLNAIQMQRDRPDNLVLMQSTEPLVPLRTLNARDFEFNYQLGYDLSVIAQPECGCGLEIRFMSLQDATANTTAITTTTMADPLQINTVPPTFVQDVDQVDATYDSGFHSMEFNLRRQCCDLSLLLGFRYLELDEQAVYGLTGSAPAATYSTFTQNRMYGVQVGADGTLTRCGRLRFDGLAKGGIYYNAAGHASFLANGVITQPASGDDDSAAFVGELGLTGVYDVNPCFAIRFGYQGLWFHSVALASDQIPATNLFTQTGIDAEGGTFFHGGVLGLEFRR